MSNFKNELHQNKVNNGTTTVFEVYKHWVAVSFLSVNNLQKVSAEWHRHDNMIEHDKINK